MVIRRNAQEPLETISHRDMLNEDEQQKLIQDFQNQNTLYNRVIKALLLLLSLGAFGFFFKTSSVYSFKEIILLISTGFQPLFILADDDQTKHPYFQIILGINILISGLALYLGGSSDVIYSLPLILQVFQAYMIYDMQKASLKIKELERHKYKLKSA